jgi:hypothetical protein
VSTKSYAFRKAALHTFASLLILSCVLPGLHARAQGLVVNVPAGGDVVGAASQVYAAGGGTINLAAGNYTIYGSIVLNSNTTLNGAGGPGSSTQSVIYAPQTPNGIAMVLANGGVQNIAVSNLVLDGNIPQAAMLYGTGGGNYAYNDTGIYVYSQSATSVGMTLTNVEVRHTVRGILTGLVDNLTISGCYFHDNNPGGFSHNMYLVATSGVEIDHTRSDNALTGDGLHIDFGGYFYTIRKSEFSGNNGYGILSQQDNSVTIEDSRLDYNTADGIQIDAGGLVLTRDQMNVNSNYGFEIPDTADGNGLVNGVYTLGDGGTDYFYQAAIVDFTIYGPPANTYPAVMATGVTGVVDTADWTLNYPGYTYEGAVDFNANHLSNGSITFQVGNAAATGSYPLVVRYSNGTSGNQTMNLSVNGGAAVAVNFPSTQSYSTWSSITVNQPLNVGNNTVTMSVPAGATSAPEIDTLTVTTSTPNAPNAPTNLTGTATGPYSVALNWTAPAAGNNNAAQTYTVYRNGANIASNITATSYTDTRIFYGESTYSYTVAAVNQGGQGGQSNSVTVTTGIDAPPGLQVTVVPSTPANNLNWLGVSGASLYLVKRATVSGGPYQTIGTVVANTPYPSYSDTGLSNGQTYYYVVAAEDANNNISANSYEVKALAQTFSLTAGSASVSLSSATPDTISVVGTNGFSDPVTFGVTGLPTGVSASLSPSSGSSTQITFIANSSAVPGNYPVSVTGTDGNLNSSVGLTLVVSYPLAQVITFNPAPQQAVGNTLTPTATASSGLPVTFSLVQNGNCSISGGVVTFLNGGACGILADQAGNAQFSAAAQVGQVVQVRAPVAQTITFGAIASQTAGTSVTLSATASSGLAVSFASSTPSVCMVSGSTASLLANGICTIVASQPGGGAYGSAASVSQSFTVGQSQTITFLPPASVTYGVAPFALNGTASSGLPISYSVVSGPGSVNGSTLTVTGAGTILLTANQAGNVAYAAATAVSASILVSPATVTVTVNAATKVYGGPLPTLSGTVGATQNGDVLGASYTTTATSASGVGQYPISAVLTGAAAVNYMAAVTPGVLTVTPATLTAMASNQSRAYGAANPALTYAVTGYVNGDSSSVLTGTPSVTTTATNTSPDGSYPIVIAQGTLSAGANYTFAFVNGSLQVNSATTTTTLTAMPAGTTYGQSVALNAKVVDANGNAVTGGMVSYSLYSAAINTATTLGSAPVNGSTGLASLSTTALPAGNQTVIAVYVPLPIYGSSGASTGVAVSPAPISITVNPATKLYGAPLPVLTGTTGTTQNGDVVNATYSTTATASSPVGSYAIGATIVGAAAANYVVTLTPAQLTVTPATLTLTATSLSRPYGTANPALTYVVTGYVNGDAPSILSGTPVLSTPATVSSPQGSYPIAIAQGTLSAGANYGFIFVNGLLTVGSNSTSITLLPSASAPTYGQQVTLSAKVLDGSGNPITSGSVAFSVNGVPLGSGPVTAGLATVQTSLLPAGTDALTASFTGGGYGASSGMGSVIVIPAPVTIVVNAQSKVYGAALPVLSGTTGPTQNGDVLTVLYTTSATAGSAVGEYPITANLTGGSAANYKATVTPAQLTITAGTLTATAASFTRAANTPNPTLTYLVSGFVNGDTSAVLSGMASLSTPATQSSPQGSYPISIAQGTLSAGANYSIAFIAGTLTVTYAGTQTLTFAPISNVPYGTPPFTVTAISSAALPVTISIVSGSNVALSGNTPSLIDGTITVNGIGPVTLQATQAGNGVYPAATPVTQSFAVTPAPLTVTASNASWTYGAPVMLTGSVTGAIAGDSFTETFATSASAASPVPAGSYAITPSVTANGATNLADYAILSVPGTLTVARASTLTKLSSSIGNANQGAAITFTVSVASTTVGVPTQLVTLMDGGTVLASGMLNVGGTANFVVNSLGAGAHSIVAMYGGDANFLPSSSSAVPESVIAPTFAVSANPADLTLSRGSAATVLLTVASSGGYSNTLQASCGGLAGQMSCTFTPAALSFTGNNGTQTMSVSVGTSGAVASVSPPVAGPRPWLAILLVFPGVAGVLGLRRRRVSPFLQRMGLLTLFAASALSAIATLAGCGAGANLADTLPGTYAVTITLTDGTVSRTQAVTVTVTP